MSQILTVSMGSPQRRPIEPGGGVRRRDWERTSMIGPIGVTAAGQSAAKGRA